MANHRAAATLLLVMSLLVAVALSGADARPTVLPDRTAALHGADAMRTGGDTMATVRRDANGPGHVGVAAATAVVEPESEYWDEEPEPGAMAPSSQNKQPGDPNDNLDKPDSVGAKLEPELCNNCEKPKPEPELTCKEVHAVQEGETCDSIVQCKELGQDDFLRFNPNICCENLFVGQWVCLNACGA